MRSPNVHIHNLGCRVNRVESDSIAASLVASGAMLSTVDTADVVVVNTCTVTGEAAAKARKAVRKMLAGSADAPVIVTGCAVAIEPECYRQLGPRVIVEADKSRIAGLVHDMLGLEVSEAEGFGRVGKGFRCRAGIKVQDGCSNACTYCIVHIARGPLWSKPYEEVRSEVLDAYRAGIGEVVLTGVDLGSYQGGTGLVGLLEELLGLPPFSTSGMPAMRIRLSSLEPPDVTPALISLMTAADGRLCRHLHLPLQSGSDGVLREMGRLYTADDYADTVAALRSASPYLSVSTDVIAGFPGESDEDFAETSNFCERMGFSKMHVFRYSRREGTPAAARDDQIDPATIAYRADALRLLGDRLCEEDAHRRIGHTEQVVVEEDGCTSESFHRALLDDVGEDDMGKLVSTRIVDVRGGSLVVERT